MPRLHGLGEFLLRRARPGPDDPKPAAPAGMPAVCAMRISPSGNYGRPSDGMALRGPGLHPARAQSRRLRVRSRPRDWISYTWVMAGTGTRLTVLEHYCMLEPTSTRARQLPLRPRVGLVAESDGMMTISRPTEMLMQFGQLNRHESRLLSRGCLRLRHRHHCSAGQ